MPSPTEGVRAPSTPSDALGALLRSEDLANGSRPSLERLAGQMRKRRLPKKCVVFLEGDDPGPACLVDEGRVRLTTARPDGTPHFVGDVGPGGLIGDLTALASRPRTTTATALTRVVLWEIPSTALRDALASDARLSFSMMMHMIDWVLSKDETAALRSAHGTSQRTARAILDLYDRSPEGAALDLTHAELAVIVGVTRESISRILASFKRRGIIETRRRGIVVLDRKRLATLAGH
jgi:CRP/FNR family transcriptional regulator